METAIPVKAHDDGSHRLRVQHTVSSCPAAIRSWAVLNRNPWMPDTVHVDTRVLGLATKGMGMQ